MVGCTLAPRLHPETEDGNAAGGKTHHLLGPWLNVTLNLFGKSGEAQDWDFFLLECDEKCVSSRHDRWFSCEWRVRVYLVLWILMEINELRQNILCCSYSWSVLLCLKCWFVQCLFNHVTDWPGLPPFDMQGIFISAVAAKYKKSSLSSWKAVAAPPLWGNWQDVMKAHNYNNNYIFQVVVESHFLVEVCMSMSWHLWLTSLSVYLPK